MHPCQDLRFNNENVQLLGGNFYGRIFTRRELSSRRECYQDFTSRQGSRRDPGDDFFLGRIPASTDFSARFLPKNAAGIFLGKTGHLGGILAGSRSAPGILAGSRRDPGEIPVPILQGKNRKSIGRQFLASDTNFVFVTILSCRTWFFITYQME